MIYKNISKNYTEFDNYHNHVCMWYVCMWYVCDHVRVPTFLCMQHMWANNNINIIRSYIFPQKFFWNSSNPSEDMNFYLFNFSYLSIFWILLTLFVTKKTNDFSFYKTILAVFWLGIILDRWFKNYIKLD